MFLQIKSCMFHFMFDRILNSNHMTLGFKQLKFVSRKYIF